MPHRQIVRYRDLVAVLVLTALALVSRAPDARLRTPATYLDGLERIAHSSLAEQVLKH